MEKTGCVNKDVCKNETCSWNAGKVLNETDWIEKIKECLCEECKKDFDNNVANRSYYFRLLNKVENHLRNKD